MITVQQLIDKLQEIEDKSVPVTVYVVHMTAAMSFELELFEPDLVLDGPKHTDKIQINAMGF